MNLFRDLKPEEEEKFREWARKHWEPNKDPLPYWHPVVRDEWAKLTRMFNIIGYNK